VRAARLVAFHVQDPAHPSLDEVINSLVDATWDAPDRDAADAAPVRVVERSVVDGLLDLAGSPRATVEVRAVAEDHLARLRDRAAGASPGAEARGHRAAIRRDIDRYFDGRDDPALRPRPEPIPLPWP
jgi:hypothetical protein